MYSDLDTIKRYLGIGESDDDALLSRIADSAQKMIDAHCGRTFEATGSTTRYFDSRCDVCDLTLRIDVDLCAIDKITNGYGVEVTSNQYVTEPRNQTPYYAIKLLRSAGVVWQSTVSGDTEDAIAITGKWAYSRDAPDDIVQCHTRLTAYLYRQKDNANDLDRAIVAGNSTIMPAQLPSDIKQILAPYRRRT